MPKKSKTKPAPSQPANLAPSSTNLGHATGSTAEGEDYKTKNARARELILSTLSPGTEPWKIAQSFEHASDIWKALEARYAPEQIEQQGKESSSDRNQGIVLNVDKRSTPARTQEAVQTGSNQIIDKEDDEKVRRKEAQARASKEFYESMPDPNQRLLWALLHGGKPETEAWFNGTVLQT